ncbi:thiamine pyrophosphokinase [Pedobacter sp. MC2016-15]|uniref:thiamine pyrophosphokinase n=1 Tax=Pedobacter sp. MC2016-15 TaxID=2994473 RepID=UPI002247E1C0|nr:thiamine pyrophosphokinase [Pedobacter sp. MC2016-15]MCX2478594.1 thiamine pyrophosphokinase [Pedobacter sp. MC2016-15]
MSSHHIVKEKQEPALYIHNLGNFDEEYLGQILEWSPTLVVNGAIYEKVISLGLKVDVVVNAPEDYTSQENTKSILGPGDEYNTVLNYLISEKYSAVNIIDVEKKISSLDYYLPKINIVLFSATEKSYAIKTGFKIWKPAGSLFLIDVVSYFEATNLMQKDEREFEVVKDGFVEFTFTTTEYVFLSEQL